MHDGGQPPANILPMTGRHMKCSAVIFDLDGTLLNTLADLAVATNAALAEAGYPTHEVDAYRHFVGNGVRMLVRRALPAGEADSMGVDAFNRVLHGMRMHYAAVATRATRPYAGIPELLETLLAENIPTAVLSNKPHDDLLTVIGNYFPDHPFRAVRGAMDGVPLKPNPASVLHIAADLQLPPRSIIYVGDSDVDVQTARAAHMIPIGAGWGYRGEEELRTAGAAMVCPQPEDVLLAVHHDWDLK